MNLKSTLNFDGLFEVKYWSPTLKQKKRVTEKRFILTSQKISLLALHTASLEPGWGLPVKSQKIDQKSIFIEKLLKKKKSYVLK
jgi:hypothetical protein